MRVYSAFRDPAILLALLLAGYGLAHGAIRLTASSAAGVDFAVEAVYSQSWRGGYDLRQPPLFAWIAHGAREVGVLGVPFFVILKYACFGATVWFLFLSARRIMARADHAAIGALSVLLLYQVGWNMHGGVTQTQLLMLAMAVTFHGVMRLAAGTAGWRTALIFGSGVAIGLLSKFGFLLFLGALLIAVMSDRGARTNIRVLPLVAGLLLAAGLTAPYWLWLAGQGEALARLPATALGADREASALARLQGAGSFLLASFGFLMPLAAVLLFVHPRLWRAPVLLGKTSIPGGVPDWTRILGRFLLIGAATGVAGVLVAGIPEVRERWLHPIWFFAGLYGALLFERTSAGPVAWRRMAGAIGVSVLVVLVLRAAEPLVGPPLCDRCRVMRDYDRLAEAIVEAGHDRGTLVATHEDIAGNLTLLLPDARVVMVHSARHVPDPDPNTDPERRACVVIWRPDHVAALPRRLREAGMDPGLLGLLDAAAATHIVSEVLPSFSWTGRPIVARWAFIPLSDPSTCP
ncbi:MAG: glycosyltransferase family 39 protein [Alphaproteobacteria bacterium]|nr:glycosyltransferase family 39 protein [Alphaproteobacteria bacterium]